MSGTAAYQVDVGDLTRTYLLRVPHTRPGGFRRIFGFPLVIILHGSGATGETVEAMSRMDSMAEARRFVVAYPDATTGAFGLRSDWNAGQCCGIAARNNVDDVAFIRSLIDSVAARIRVDRNRIYVAGFSDGARMTYRAACELSAEIAAIAVVSGSLTDAHCVPQRPVPLIAFHGTADDEVAFDDSAYTAPPAAPLTSAANLPPAIRFWSAVNQCKGVTRTRQAPHVTEAQFDGCAADVMFYTIEGGLHAWPGGAADGDNGAEPTGEIFASREAIRFFFHHPKP
ncbi:MAG: alpha/beta hydrolase family esterase [Gemmatimonadaceae bacterium]